MKTTFTKESFFSLPREAVFAFHERPDAFQLLTPPSHNIEVISTASTLKPSDDVVRFIASFLFLKLRFEMVHTDYDPPQRFVDQQQKGLFSSWKHEHRFISGGWEKEPASMLSDTIAFSHPLLPLFVPFVRHRLSSLFAYRHQKTREAVGQQTKNTPHAGATVLITGATGLIGRRITEILLEMGVRVVALCRNVKEAGRTLGSEVETIYWDFTRPDEGGWKHYLDGADAVIHLAGTPLFKQRWTGAFKKEIRESRVSSTRLLVEAIRNTTKRPPVFISASAVGIYGTDPNRVCGEDASPADDLLAEVCTAWEHEAKQLDAEGIRTVQIRIGIVLDTRSGALKEVLPLFRFGLGGTLGLPDPWFNWITLEDVARIFVTAAFNPELKGPYNAVAPHPVTNREFARTVGRVLKRPLLGVYPIQLLKIMIGDAADYSSGGAKALSEKIQQAGYRFFFEELEPALHNAMRA
jgi:uncharacterized protein (TIGR01777 family)